MSRWLSSVNNLLDKLDGQVETAVDDHHHSGNSAANLNEDLPTSRGAIDDILSRRGLAASNEDSQQNDTDDDQEDEYFDGDEEEYYDEDDENDGDDEEEDEFDDEVDDNEDDYVEEEEDEEEEYKGEEEEVQQQESDESGELIELEDATESETHTTVPLFDDDTKATMSPPTLPAAPPSQEAALFAIPQPLQHHHMAEIEVNESKNISKTTSSPPPPPSLPPPQPQKQLEKVVLDKVSTGLVPTEQIADVPTQNIVSPSSEPIPTSQIASTKPPPRSGQISVQSTTKATTENKELQSKYKKSQRDVRKLTDEIQELRKHVVSLHESLEKAESEIKAQNIELERAGERIEQERVRLDEEHNELLDEHENEIDNLKNEYETLLEEQKANYSNQINDLHTRLNNVEEIRMQEGGDWNKELHDSMERERDAIKKLANVQDENRTLESKLTKLDSQLTMTTNKLDNMTNNYQQAIQRERNVEDKLDGVLSSYSRQLSQSKSRESELERTVADLGSALAIERQKSKKSTSASQGGSASPSNINKEQLSEIIEELETLRSQYISEEQRRLTLESELKEISNERNVETSKIQIRQDQTDKHINELNGTISKLQNSLREKDRQLKQYEKENYAGTDDGNDNKEKHQQYSKKQVDELHKQIQSLSEQHIKQQKALESKKTEILTLKSRLQQATIRADDAEQKNNTTSSLAVSSGGAYFETDASGGVYQRGGNSNKLRRRVKGGNSSLRGSGGSNSNTRSISSALNLRFASNYNENMEPLIQTVDAIDSFMIDTGSIFKQEPIARFAFFLYLCIMHIWTFCLVIFHAHSYEDEHPDFGSLKVH